MERRAGRPRGGRAGTAPALPSTLTGKIHDGYKPHRRVADFIDSSNFFDGTLVERDADKTRIRLADGSEIVTPSGEAATDGSVVVAIRPEKIEIAEEDGPNRMRVTVDQRTYLGSVRQYGVRSGSIEFRIRTPVALKAESIFVHLPAEHCAVFLDKPGAN